MQFTDIRAQETAIETLKRALSLNKVHHAYLFSGPGGVGKHLAATALAMSMNCGAKKDDACSTCPSCKKILRGVHPDVLHVTLPEGKNLIPIESVRELGQRLAVRPHEGACKVAIIDPADRLSESAANALLKTLEEPRPGSFLILITSKASSLLATVRSRCQLVRFRALPKEVVADILQNQGVSKEEAQIVAALCGGSLDQASAYLDEETDERIRLAFDLVENALEPTPQKGLQVAAYYKGKRDDVLILLELLVIILGELLWANTHPEDEGDRVLSTRLGDRLAHLSQKISVEKIADFVAAAHSAEQKIVRNNMNPQLALESMLMSMRGRTDDGLTGSGLGVL
jgi:DNA polymerase-3 subunit delta'